MGQVESQATTPAEEPSPPAVEPSPPSAAPPPSSLEALAAEAMSFDENDTEESIDVKVQKALDCPCVADLKNGPCGGQFVDAFSCFLRSTEEEKGVPSAESSRSVRGLGKGVSGKPYPRLCNARRLRLEPGTFRSQAGSDCVKPFIALQDCIKANPEAFSKEILEEEENDEEAEKSNLKVRAPSWSRESKPKV
ncbi:mitochondrial intermembrane space import and assembly protein 40 homolog isoform X1 [Miscanthus floridulus]|uniref:mitochondrial intermembrane space import and assembly protein 40 homolog isoform X1 n=1 Tax=Miscanthus floridulus TaxID=154761 RepID=UPI00345926CC